MNERIRQLAEQQGLTGPNFLISSQELEKFAELLLKDCVQILERRDEHPVIVNSIKEIKETFGVEE
jgi:hypothetical protein